MFFQVVLSGRIGICIVYGIHYPASEGAHGEKAACEGYLFGLDTEIKSRKSADGVITNIRLLTQVKNKV